MDGVTDGRFVVLKGGADLRKAFNSYVDNYGWEHLTSFEYKEDVSNKKICGSLKMIGQGPDGILKSEGTISSNGMPFY